MEEVKWKSSLNHNKITVKITNHNKITVRITSHNKITVKITSQKKLRNLRLNLRDNRVQYAILIMPEKKRIGCAQAVLSNIFFWISKSLIVIRKHKELEEKEKKFIISLPLISKIIP